MWFELEHPTITSYMKTGWPLKFCNEISGVFHICKVFSLSLFDANMFHNSLRSISNIEQQWKLASWQVIG